MTSPLFLIPSDRPYLVDHLPMGLSRCADCSFSFTQPREALLKYAEVGENDPQWTAGEYCCDVAERLTWAAVRFMFGYVCRWRCLTC